MSDERGSEDARFARLASLYIWELEDALAGLVRGMQSGNTTDALAKAKEVLSKSGRHRVRIVGQVASPSPVKPAEKTAKEAGR